MKYNIDTCSVFRGVLVVDGWADLKAPEIFYKGELVASAKQILPRPDVAREFGEHALHWGFKVCALLTPEMRHYEDLELRFGDDLSIRAPSTAGTAEDNHTFNTMTQTLLAESRPGDRVLEIGSRARSGNTHRYLVNPEVEYVGIDITDGPNVDVVGDAHHLSRHVTGEFDAIFSVSVFEHLLMPWMVALEMNKVLRTGGLAYIQSHACFPLHDQPWDFWRFSKEAWSGLFNAHTGFEMVEQGNTMRCRIAPDWFSMQHLEQGFDNSGSYILTACLVRKIGAPKVSWDAEAADVYNLAYDH